MEAKLIKRPNGIRWDLYLKKDINMLNTIASSEDGAVGKLSLKNCEAIENGYDLDELAMGYDLYENINFVGQMRAFKAGFQKALEILGDKKFTEDDIRKTIFIVSNPLDTRYSSSEIISSLQQTEWDVEIILEVINHGKGEDGLLQETVEPKLDADGCLILKRI
jgi:hypothetical protein